MYVLYTNLHGLSHVRMLQAVTVMIVLVACRTGVHAARPCYAKPHMGTTAAVRVLMTVTIATTIMIYLFGSMA